MTVAENIRRIIKEKMMIQAEVARRLGVTPKTLNNMLTGRQHIKVSAIPAICKVLGVEPNDLFDFDDTA